LASRQPAKTPTGSYRAAFRYFDHRPAQFENKTRRLPAFQSHDGGLEHNRAVVFGSGARHKKIYVVVFDRWSYFVAFAVATC
jgi:hypothetical protein